MADGNAGAVFVELTPAELMLAATQGAMRYIANLRDGRRDRHGRGADSNWNTHIEGVCGELAFAKAIGAYWWNRMGDFRADDVGAWQVRMRSETWHELIVHEHDRDDRVFVLLTGRVGRYRVVGWIRGHDAKRREWWRDPARGRPAFFVPQNRLTPGLPPRL
jgi:hypothetical protein